MKPRALLLVVLTTLALVGPGAVGDARASLPAPIDLRVTGGEETWHPENRFFLQWKNPDTGFSLPITDVGYLIRDRFGAVVKEARLGWAGHQIDNLTIPGPPGVYTAVVWFEDRVGAGNPAAVSLRYDDTRPATARAVQPDRWLGRSDFSHLIEIEHPQGPPPPSGIRGYAISIDRSSDGQPCAGPSRCTDTETDLRGGIEDDSLPVAELPEGENHVHVVAVSGSGMRSAAIGDTVLRVDRTDPTTDLGGVPSGWTNRAIPVTVTARDSASGMEGDGAFTAIQIDGGPPTVADGDSVSSTVIGDGVHRIAHYARDAAGNVNDGATRNGVRDLLPSISTVRIDRDPPEVAFLDSQDPADPELIRAQVTDPMSGPSADRGSIAIRALGSGDRFQPIPTQVLGDSLRARWDSEAYPPGRYEFRASGYDDAGNMTITQRRVDRSVMALANPLKTPTALSIGFGGERLVWQNCTRSDGGRHCRREAVSALGRRPQRRVVPYGRGTLISGRLTTEAGAPIAGAPVRILEQLGRGAGAAERIATVGTDSAGWFSIRVEEGPSREISATFGGSRTLTRSAATSLRLGVRSKITIRASSPTARVGGRPVVFSGRLIAGEGEIPAEGRSLSLQFRVPGVPWTEFRTVRTDAHGRFRYAYRFSDDDSRGVRFQFRAHAATQSDWPYEPGSSGPVAVLGI